MRTEFNLAKHLAFEVTAEASLPQREIRRILRLLGFRYEGVNGRGHHAWRHPIYQNAIAGSFTYLHDDPVSQKSLRVFLREAGFPLGAYEAARDDDEQFVPPVQKVVPSKTERELCAEQMTELVAKTTDPNTRQEDLPKVYQDIADLQRRMSRLPRP